MAFEEAAWIGARAAPLVLVGAFRGQVRTAPQTAMPISAKPMPLYTYHGSVKNASGRFVLKMNFQVSMKVQTMPNTMLNAGRPGIPGQVSMVRPCAPTTISRIERMMLIGCVTHSVRVWPKYSSGASDTAGAAALRLVPSVGCSSEEGATPMLQKRDRLPDKHRARPGQQTDKAAQTNQEEAAA